MTVGPRRRTVRGPATHPRHTSEGGRVAVKNHGPRELGVDPAKSADMPPPSRNRHSPRSRARRDPGRRGLALRQGDPRRSPVASRVRTLRIAKGPSLFGGLIDVSSGSAGPAGPRAEGPARTPYFPRSPSAEKFGDFSREEIGVRAMYPSFANRWVTSWMCGSGPKISWITTTAGRHAS